MKRCWNLEALYSSFDSPELKDDFKKCFEKIDDLKCWVKENLHSYSNTTEKMKHYLNSRILIEELVHKLHGYFFLSISINVKDEKSSQFLDRLQRKMAELTKPTVAFQKWISSVDNLDEIISSSEFLKEHEFYLKEARSIATHILNEDEEAIIAKMSNTGAGAWAKLHSKLVSTLSVDINIDGTDKQMPLSMVRGMAFDKNQETRVKAYKAELKGYKKIEESIAAALNSIKGQSITTSSLRGYSSPLESTLINARMDNDTLDVMYAAVKEKLPILRKYLRKKAEALGHKDGLPIYDMFAPLGKVNLRFTYEEAKDFIINNFRAFSNELADFADKAFENNWIDSEPRENKRGGAFCLNIPSVKESRILTNFNGSYASMKGLAHELGHAYHGQCLFKESILNTEYTKPIAETASILCETIVKKSALKNATQEEKLAILSNSLQTDILLIIDVYSAFLFEKRVFETRKDYALSVEELKNLMIECQKEAYGDGLDHNYLHPYTWINKSQYYSATLDFYNYPYTFGLLFSKGLYSEFTKGDKSFAKDYNKLLAATGKNSIVDVAKMIDIDINSLDFWRSSLDIVVDDVNRFLELS